MQLTFDTEKFINSHLKLVDYMILLAYDKSTYSGHELAAHLGKTADHIWNRRKALINLGYIGGRRNDFYLTEKGKLLIAA